MISSLAHIHPNANIAENVTIDPFAVIEQNVTIGSGTHVMSHTVIKSNTTVGKNCQIFPGAVLGAIPQDLKFDGEITSVEIGDGTSIRECVTVNRGTQDRWKTIVGKNCLLMAYTHVAHDCLIGDHVVIANAVQLAGHVEVGDYAIIGGMAAAIQFVRVGAHTYIAGKAEIIKDIPPYIKAGRNPLTYSGINSVGLQRRGYSAETINSILDTYRYIYQRGLNITQALEHIESHIAASVEKENILRFIKESKRGILKLSGHENGNEG